MTVTFVVVVVVVVVVVASFGGSEGGAFGGGTDGGGDGGGGDGGSESALPPRMITSRRLTLGAKLLTYGLSIWMRICRATNPPWQGAVERDGMVEVDAHPTHAKRNLGGWFDTFGEDRQVERLQDGLVSKALQASNERIVAEAGAAEEAAGACRQVENPHLRRRSFPRPRVHR